MRSTSSHILAMSLLGFGLIGLGLLALVQPDSESGIPPATLADQLSDGSASAVKSLADYGTPSSERNAGEVPQRIPLPDGLKAALGPEFDLLREPQQVPFVIRETSRKFQHSLSDVTLWVRRP